MLKKAWLPYLKTLRRLPDEVVLDMATREFDMGDSEACVCGWALRAALSSLNGKTPEEFTIDDYNPGYNTTEPPRLLRNRYGGSLDEWRAIYVGVLEPEPDEDEDLGPLEGHLPEIERAFVERVAEACK